MLPTGDGFTDDGGDHAANALAELDAIWANGVGVLEVTPGTDAAARLARRKGSAITPDNRLTLHYSDMNLLADELAGYGPEVLVLSPPWLRDAVLSRLEQTAEAHGRLLRSADRAADRAADGGTAAGDPGDDEPREGQEHG